MYRPDQFRVDDLSLMYALMRAKPLVALVSGNAGGLYACPYRKLDPDVLMVESTEHRPSFDTTVTLNGPSIGCILP
jgi:predicted FMN-binding regulatory protein PaiB